ncbi:phosphatase PAP2 family protein [Candidatus Daviesbacteria bacterium]|nr:phosphatase PAP2 family protein [Candidatus Daviesbacteria bacterium]
MNLRIGLFTINLVLLFLYIPLNNSRPPLYTLETKLDDFIPLVPFFIIPYLSFYIYLILTVFSLRNARYINQLYITLSSTLLTISISYFAYLFFQTQVIRPTITETDIFSKIISFIHTIDKPYNAFPSTHASLSTIGLLTWTHKKSKYSKLFIIWAIAIIFSTLLVKQHYLVDIVGGIILAILCYLLCSKLNFFGHNF